MSGVPCLLMGMAVVFLTLSLATLPRLLFASGREDRLVVLDAFNTLVSLALLLAAAACESLVMVDIAIVYIVVSFIVGLCLVQASERGV